MTDRSGRSRSVWTTLKRGYGRAAEAGANGSANGHAVLPPTPGSPMTRYRQPEPPPSIPEPEKAAAEEDVVTLAKTP